MTGKLKADVKEKWLAALREPGRKQTRGYLEIPTEAAAMAGDAVVGQCCLGVLCEIAAQEGVAVRVAREASATRYLSAGDDETVGNVGLPPRGVSDWAFEPLTQPSAINPWWIDEIRTSLNSMNDDGASFAEIADAIEEYM